MTPFDKLSSLLHIIRWRLTWNRKDLDFLPRGPVLEKFITARAAAKLFADGATVCSNGLAGNARCSAFYWAIRELFLQTGHPRNLTWVNVGAQGGRGKVPGTIEEIGLPGLMKLYLAGHLETCKAQLKLAEQGQLELHTLPQGVMTHLLEAQARGETTIRSHVGVGTFLDPRVDIGSALTPNAGNQFVKADGDALIYSMPRVEMAIMNAPYADADGNIYFTNAASLTESLESAHAARANGGKVLVTVSAVVPKNEAQIALRAHEVDAVVVHPYNEQTASVPQSRYWPMFTEGSKVHAPAAIEKLRYINNVLKITPVRGPVEFVLARLGATMLCRMVGPGAMVNIGVGFPEEVARQLVDHGLYDQLLFSTEAGAYGGLPAPGIFFSAAISPQHLESSAATFHRYANGLDAAILGFLQVDSAGNVNASHRGPRITDTVGPGGFPDIAAGARNIVFVGSWMAGANMVIENGKIRIVKPGTCKFVSQVDHITFNAAEALRMGKQVYYVTHVGVFELTEQGIALRQVMPGIDIQKDIVEASTANIVVPFQEPVPLVNSSVLTGGHFTLQLKNQAMATA